MPASAAPAPRRGRWLVLGALLLGVAAISFAIVELSTEEGGEPRFDIEGIGEMQRYFGGVPQSQTRFGSDDAPVEVIVFDDVQCAGCAEHFLEVIPPLAEGPVRDGEIKLEYRHYSF